MLGFAFLWIAVLLVSTAEAGVISITYTDLTPGSTTDLTAAGTLDWVKWGNGETTGTLPYASPQKVGGSIINPTLSPLGSVPAGQSVELVPFAPVQNVTPAFSWTNGTLAMSGGNPVGTSVSETIVPAQFSYPLGLGLSFQASADVTTRVLNLYVVGFNSRMELDASLSGGGGSGLLASNAALVPVDAGGAGNNFFSFGVFSIVYSGAGQTLTVDLTANNQSGISSSAPQFAFPNAGVFAATVSASAVPEPSALLLSAIGLAGLLGARVFRRALTRGQPA
jgi:hypothetical protein